jgi:hypothetical protein
MAPLPHLRRRMPSVSLAEIRIMIDVGVNGRIVRPSRWSGGADG